MKTTPEINKRMPYSSFNWNEHSARTSRLTLEERGMFDVVRCELWTVAPPRLPLGALMSRLRIASGAREEGLVTELLSLGLLVEEDSQVYDPVQAYEFSAAVAKSITNRENGSKGGRPRRGSAAVAQPPVLSHGSSAEDF